MRPRFRSFHLLCQGAHRAPLPQRFGTQCTPLFVGTADLQSLPRKLRLQSPITAFPLLKGEDGLVELPSAEVRPERVGHVDLCISNLPQQEIADAQLATGSYQ